MNIFNFLKRKNHPPALQVGDCWTYKGLPGNKESILTVLKIEGEGEQKIVHIRLDGLLGPQSAGAMTISHLPFSADVLIAGLDRKIGVVSSLPDFSEGYDMWKKNKGGAWNIPIQSVTEMFVR